ncbi:50S ribosomal protein L6 [endosymbiont GvMRE of Glomus versiforme]|uniref:50S ribosomal protein L6 n=1 Tax=endosymbiont GvMRE of Glomus versiforme TaxID=2039283 RepID=UPI000EBC63E8|nr:50S ribosomal protein L6 [endosymbiont GvMRE of Glomus versiforme]RHZ35506.1 50S ribosomal protein L6 [endosymbiont GvMRE of Glomus versiforme]
MSRIANRIISIPENVKVRLEKEKIFVKSSTGEREELNFPVELEVIIKSSQISTKSKNNPLAGTYNSLIYNMIKGVLEGYQCIVEVKGVGYKVILKDKKLEFSLARSHLNYVDIPQGLEVTVEKNKIVVKGSNKQKVSSFVANKIRSLRLPSIYKESKGIYYIDEEKTIKIKKKKNVK